MHVSSLTKSSVSMMLIIVLFSITLRWSAAARNPRPKMNQYFRFDEKTSSWVPVELPYSLVTCVNDNCTVVGSIIDNVGSNRGDKTVAEVGNVNDVKKAEEKYKKILPLRKRISVTKMSEASLWITGESGSIYERFWNGVHWVFAPHDLPASAGPAVSVFIVNHTILALSESGVIYQMQLTENSQLFWKEFSALEKHRKMKSGFVTQDGARIYFCTMNGSLLELVEVDPPRWENHSQPPGADVAAIADAGTVRQNLVFTVSSGGELYEHERSRKPPWKKHIKKEESQEDTLLIPSRGCIAHGLAGTSSVSLFLVTKAGKLIERRLYRRKWRWISHGSTDDQLLTSMVSFQLDETSDKYSLFLTTASGSILEHQITKQAGVAQESETGKTWVNHRHPPHAKVARGVQGMPYQFGRLFFPLDDGRLAELHLPGYGGENVGPTNQINTRKRGVLKYTWAVLDAPETEGWNAEYCTAERGPFNCMTGVKDEANSLATSRTVTRRQKGLSQSYLIPDLSDVNQGKTGEKHKLSEQLVNSNFKMRKMQGSTSYFLVADSGLTFEFLYNNDVGLWLRLEHSTLMNGAVGSYNGSIFFVDVHGSLLIRERSNNEIKWINCTAMKKGRQIVSGPPWDMVFGTTNRVSSSDALYFVSKNGKLLQFTVAEKTFKWKDCKNPGNTKVASIVDQEVFREKVIFITGRNGRLYQYNTLYGKWHEHYQSQHMILSKSPGTATRGSKLSSTGSLFMISEDGGLVEYHWNSLDGWMWVEHGTPHGGVSFRGATGPSYEGHQLFIVGSDGEVYLRYFVSGEWKWREYKFPDFDNFDDLKVSKKTDTNCDPKVSNTRPIPSAEDKVIFELRDGRLAEMYRVKDFEWTWSKIIATPTSLCRSNFRAAGAS